MTETKSDNGFIYFIHESKYQNSNIPVYKIGYTLRTIQKRLSDYENGYKILYTFHCKDPKLTEKIIIKIFTLKYKLYSGRERFKGDVDEMIQSIKKIEDYERNHVDTCIYRDTKISKFYQNSLKNIRDEFAESDYYKVLESLISSFYIRQMHRYLFVNGIKIGTPEYIKQMRVHSKIINLKNVKIDILSYIAEFPNETQYIPILKRFLKDIPSQPDYVNFDIRSFLSDLSETHQTQYISIPKKFIDEEDLSLTSEI